MKDPGMIAVFGGLYAWAIYRRLRRNIGPQRLRPTRIIISIVIFSLISLLFLSLSIHDMRLLAGIGGGLLLGAGLGLVGLKLSKFETTEAGHFYTPNTYLGIAVSALFIGRLAYNSLVPREMVTVGDHQVPALSPLTFFLFGLTAGYYIVYYVGLFVHTHDKKPAAPANSVPPVLPGAGGPPSGI